MTHPNRLSNINSTEQTTHQGDQGLEELMAAFSQVQHELARKEAEFAEEKASMQQEISLYELKLQEVDRLSHALSDLQDEILDAMDEMQDMNEKLHEMNVYLQNVENQLQSKSNALEYANKKLTDSISYAKRIQEALLPDMHRAERLLPNSFVWWQPKDIVSGDFYWVFEKNYQLVVVAADCTGHGVPGAFMSAVGIRTLHEIVAYQGIIEPEEILEALDKHISAIFYQSGKYLRDGMDMSVCVVDRTPDYFQEAPPRTVRYAGARNPLLYVKRGEVIRVKGDKRSIGEQGQIPFTKHIIEIEPGMSFYLFSDGLQDQFGGEGRKLSLRGLEHLIEQHHSLSMKEQRAVLIDAFEKWKHGEIQIDDILVMGFAI